MVVFFGYGGVMMVTEADDLSVFYDSITKIKHTRNKCNPVTGLCNLKLLSVVGYIWDD